MRKTTALDKTARERVVRARLGALFTGTLLVLGGSAVALWLPVGVAGALALGVLLRLCWLEENIRTDLMRATRMPASYLRTQRLQAQWQRALLGSAHDPVECPRRLASEMRLQVHALHTFFAGAAAGLLVRAFDQPAVALIVGATVFVGALYRVDRLVEAEAAMAEGEVLSEEMLEDIGPIARFVINR